MDAGNNFLKTSTIAELRMVINCCSRLTRAATWNPNSPTLSLQLWNFTRLQIFSTKQQICDLIFDQIWFRPRQRSLRRAYIGDTKALTSKEKGSGNKVRTPKIKGEVFPLHDDLDLVHTLLSEAQPKDLRYRCAGYPEQKPILIAAAVKEVKNATLQKSNYVLPCFMLQLHCIEPWGDPLNFHNAGPDVVEENKHFVNSSGGQTFREEYTSKED